MNLKQSRSAQNGFHQNVYSNSLFTLISGGKLVNNFMNDVEVVTWLLQSISIPKEVPSLIMCEGHGPYRWQFNQTFGEYFRAIAEREQMEVWLSDQSWLEFADLLDIVLYTHHTEFIEFFEYPDLEMLIVGRDGWSEENLVTALRMRAGRTLKVYSQEMFLTYLIAGKDPFDEPASFIRRFGEGHSALEFLMDVDVGFDWPSTQVSSQLQSQSQVEFDRPKKGLLRYFGYRVGNSSQLTASRRRAVLRKLLVQPFTPKDHAHFDESYLDEWSKPNSGLRLQKLANTIAALCRSEKKRMQKLGFDYAQAIAEREADLAWLRREYYSGRFRFAWPSTQVE